MQDFGHIRFEMGYASAIATVLFIIMLFSWFLINKVLKKFAG
jgi:multiple sugar transport system permease protein